MFMACLAMLAVSRLYSADGRQMNANDTNWGRPHTLKEGFVPMPLSSPQSEIKPGPPELRILRLTAWTAEWPPLLDSLEYRYSLNKILFNDNLRTCIHWKEVKRTPWKEQQLESVCWLEANGMFNVSLLSEFLKSLSYFNVLNVLYFYMFFYLELFNKYS
jgi:hypothetical protein